VFRIPTRKTQSRLKQLVVIMAAETMAAVEITIQETPAITLATAVEMIMVVVVVDGPEIPDSIVGGTCRGQRDHDLGAAIAEQKRIAIGRTLRDHGGSEHAAGAGDILDVDWPEQCCHLVGPGPTDLVTCGAGSVRDHQPDGTRWVVVSLGVAWHSSQCGGAHKRFKELSP